jgi:DivIVA domain-containing protein
MEVDMGLSSENIQKKEFHIVFKGYKPEEVDKFLDVLSVEFEGMQRRIRDLEEKIESLKYEGDSESLQMKKVIQEALVSAHRVAQEIKRKARVEAEEFVSKMKVKEEQELRDIKDEKKLIEADISRLKMEYSDFKERITRFADDFKQKTLNMKNSIMLDELEDVNHKHGEGEGTGSENRGTDQDLVTKEETGTSDEPSEGQEDRQIEEEKIEDSDLSWESKESKKISTDPEKEQGDINEELGNNELKELASLTDEMLERLNKENDNNIDHENTDLDEPEKNKEEDKGKINRKKIDIANPDIINNFFKTDEE